MEGLAEGRLVAEEQAESGDFDNGQWTADSERRLFIFRIVLSIVHCPFFIQNDVRSLLEHMRRFLAPGLLILILLGACTRQGEFPPDEVLRRAAQAVNQLQSASFQVKGMYTTPSSTSLGFDVKGSLANGGKELAFDVRLSGHLADDTGKKHAVNAQADVVVTMSDVFFRLRSISISPPHPAIHMEQASALVGTWYRLPSSPQASTADVTPDPALLRAQAEVVRVVEDRGLVRVGDHDAYNYAVEADTQKLQHFLEAVDGEAGKESAVALGMMFAGMTGDMLINSETFFVDKFRWSSTSANSASLSLDMTLTNHNDAPPIVPPQGAVLFDLANAVPVAIPASTQQQVEPGAFPFLP